jgi:hypothetical protein
MEQCMGRINIGEPKATWKKTAEPLRRQKSCAFRIKLPIFEYLDC